MKTWRVFTKRQAEEDVNEIWSYIAQDNHQAAEAFLSAVEAECVNSFETPLC